MKEKLLQLINETPGILLSSEQADDLVEDIQAIVIQHLFNEPGTLPAQNQFRHLM